MLQDGLQELLIELEGRRELMHHLPHALDELMEHRRPSGIPSGLLLAVSYPLSKSVPEAHEFFLYQHLKPNHSPVIGIYWIGD